MKSLILVSCFFFSIFSFSQIENKNAVMSKVICECLENAEKEGTLKDDFEKTYKECQKGAVFAGALSQITKDKDTTLTLNPNASLDTIDQSDMEATLELLSNECDLYNKYNAAAVSVENMLLGVTEIACDCIGEVSTNISQADKNNAIKQCTTEAIVSSNSIQELKLGTVEKMRSFLKLVSNNLVENCPAVERLIFSNDEEKLNSYSTNEKAMEFYLDGIDYMEAEKYSKAIKLYEKGVKLDPKFVFAWDNLGRSYRLINKFDKAIKAYEKSYEVDSLNPTSIMNMAVAYNYKNDFKSAAFWYKKLIEVNPKDPEGHYGLALTYMNQQLIEDSLKKAIDARQLYLDSNSPYSADAEKMIGFLYRMFVKENKEDLFNKICTDNNLNIKLD